MNVTLLSFVPSLEESQGVGPFLLSRLHDLHPNFHRSLLKRSPKKVSNMSPLEIRDLAQLSFPFFICTSFSLPPIRSCQCAHRHWAFCEFCGWGLRFWVLGWRQAGGVCCLILRNAYGMQHFEIGSFIWL